MHSVNGEIEGFEVGKASAGNEQRWRRHIEQYLRGRLSRREYCECHQLKQSTFDYWRRRLVVYGTSPSPTPPTVNVVRVDVEAVPAPVSAPLEVVLANGRAIRVPVDFDAPTLERVLSVLETRS